MIIFPNIYKLILKQLKNQLIQLSIYRNSEVLEVDYINNVDF